MAKRGFGLAGVIEPGRKIFYESLFSQFQMGRMIDLFSAVADEAGVHVPSLRAVLHAALTEACRCQGLFDTSLGALDPVTIEVGADSLQGAVSIQFTVAEGMELSPQLAQALFSALLPARGLALKVDPETRRAEISCLVPLDLGSETDAADGASVTAGDAPRFELLQPDSVDEEESGANGSGEAENEYVELGNVDYERLVFEESASEGGETALESTRKILAAVASEPGAKTTVSGSTGSESEEETRISPYAQQEEIAKILASGLPEEELARAVKGAMSEEELARTVTGGLPEEELAQIVKGGMSEEELARTVLGGLPEEELARIVKGSSTPKELQKLVKISGDKEQIAEAVIAGSTPQEAAELIKASVAPEELGQAIATALPKEKLANLAATALPPEELVRLARANMPEEQFVQTVRGGLTPQQAASFSAHAIKSPEVCKAVLGTLSPAEIAQALKTAAPQRIDEAVRARAARMSGEDLLETLSNGLPREEFAKLVAASIPREEFSRILKDGLPPHELARSLYEGLPKDKFAQLVSAVIPKNELAESLQSLKLESAKLQDMANALGPTQQKLEPRQVAQLLEPELTQQQALSVLSAVLPRGAAESILTGAIPGEEVAQAIRPYLPLPEMAQKVTDRLLGAQPVGGERGGAPNSAPFDSGNSEIDFSLFEKTEKPAAEEADSSEPEARAASPDAAKSPSPMRVVQGGKNPEAKDAKKPSGSSRSQTPSAASDPDSRSFDAERAQLEQVFQSRLASVKKTVEFYLARTRNLETQLRASEETKRAAQQEAQAAQLKLEKVFEQSASVSAPESADGEATPSAASKPESRAGSEAEKRSAQEPVGSTFAKSAVPAQTAPKPSSERVPTAVKGAAPATAASALSDARAAKEAAKDKEAAQFFQKKARDMEQSLRKAETEVRRLNAEHTKELLKLGQEKQALATELAKAAQAVSAENALPGSSPENARDDVSSEAAEESGVGAAEQFAGKAGKPGSISSANPAAKSAPGRSDLKANLKAEPKADPVATEKIRQLEAKLRHAESEKERLNHRLSEELARPRGEAKDPAARSQGSSSRTQAWSQGQAERSQPSIQDAESPESAHAPSAPSTSGTPNTLGPSASAGADRSSSDSQDGPDPIRQASEEPDSAPIEVTRPFEKDDDSVDVGEKIERTGQELERDMTTIAQKVERLKESVPEGPARRSVDGLMTAVMQEKAKLTETSREMSKSIRKKELAFKNQEAMLTESLKQMRALAEQRQTAVDRLKQQMSEMQQRMDKTQNQTGSNETQYRMKYEQGQRQIELLNKEIEKANRRLQQAPQTQGNNLAQERVITEIRKQLENANKALTAKKQELEMTKIQITERDRREEQYKRQVMKLQSELLTARGNKKAS